MMMTWLLSSFVLSVSLLIVPLVLTVDHVNYLAGA